MFIDPHAAHAFIEGYKRLLSEFGAQSKNEPHEQLLQRLIAARRVAVQTPSRLDAAFASIDAQGDAVPQDIVCAIKSLQLKRWVYLRDTTRYSVFIEANGGDAYAVLGLTNRIRDMLGGSAVVFTAGVVAYEGRYVCDGLIEGPIWLGSNLKREIGVTLAELKRSGHFHVRAL